MKRLSTSAYLSVGLVDGTARTWVHRGFLALAIALFSAEVAIRLGIRQKTVETFREKIKRKLELSNSNQLIQHAVQWVLERQ